MIFLTSEIQFYLPESSGGVILTTKSKSSTWLITPPVNNSELGRGFYDSLPNLSGAFEVLNSPSKGTPSSPKIKGQGRERAASFICMT